jgi:hypothetical protein
MRTNTTTQKHRLAWIRNKYITELFMSFTPNVRCNTHSYNIQLQVMAYIGMFSNAIGTAPFHYRLVTTLNTAGYAAPNSKGMYYASTVTLDQAPGGCIGVYPHSSGQYMDEL